MQTADTDRFVTLEARLTRAETRLRTLSICAMLGVVAAFAIGFHKEAIAQGYTMTLAQAAARITALESKTASISTLTDNNNNPVVRFTGVNVQIVDGSGDTTGVTNGRGNLVIGYNEVFTTFGDERGGSHNLVMGTRNDYTRYGGIVGGTNNRITGVFACVLTGEENEATAEQAAIVTGLRNRATFIGASILAGNNNTASGADASISGGNANTASGITSNVSGGSTRTALTTNQWVAGALIQPN